MNPGTRIKFFVFDSTELNHAEHEIQEWMDSNSASVISSSTTMSITGNMIFTVFYTKTIV